MPSLIFSAYLPYVFFLIVSGKFFYNRMFFKFDKMIAKIKFNLSGTLPGNKKKEKFPVFFSLDFFSTEANWFDFLIAAF